MSRQLFHSAPYWAGRLLALGLGVVYWLALAIDLPYTFEAGKVVGDASRDHPRLTEEAAAQLASAGGTPTGFSAYFTIMILFVYLSFWLVAAILYLRGPRTGMVLITTLWLLSFGLMFPTNLNGLNANFPQWHPYISLIQLLSSVLFGWTFLSFPNGKVNSAFVFRLAAVGSIIVPLANIAGDYGTSRLQTASNIALAIWLLLVVWIMGYRYFRTFDVTEKLQAKWFFAAVTAAVCLLLLGWTADIWLSDIWSEFLISSTIYLAFMAIPVSLGIALLRYRLWDIDPIINRAIVYSTLTVCLLAVYSLVVLYVGSLIGPRNWFSSLMGAGAVSVIFQPLRIHLGRMVNRMMYGKADEPYSVLTGLSRRLGQSYTPKDALQTIVNTIRESFHLPYSAILLIQGEEAGRTNEDVVAQSGKITNDVIRKPLAYQGEVCGYLVMAPRGHGETFRPKDERLLEQLAFQAGAVIHAYRLTSELQNSRQKLVITRENERHRIRRDLHDGLGPLLAAQALHVGTVRHMMAHNPEAAKGMLTRMEEELSDAVAEIRRIVYNLRPPSLDDMGLIEAIAELGRKYSSGIGSFQVEFSAPSSLPPLEAAVEVALYRISQETLHNIHRHAQADHVSISLYFANTAELTVEDNGIGLNPANERQTGVGLFSIRERAEELGGRCLIENRAGGQTGTRVQVTIPITVAGKRAGEA